VRFERLTLQGLGPFSKKVEVNLGELPGPLVAVTGENGAGKTVLLELLLAALYRKTPTRGTLASLATTRESFVELVASNNGQAFTARQTVDAVSGKGEALLLGADGKPLDDSVKSGKRRDFDKWVAKNLPTSDVLTASTFGAQRSLGFIDLDPGPRKGVLLRVLGHEGLEAQSKIAGDHARRLKGELATCVARLNDELERSGDPTATQVELHDADATATKGAADLAAAEKARDELAAAWTQHRTDDAAWQLHANRDAELRKSLAAAVERLAGIELRLKNNRAALADAAAIRTAVAKRDELRVTHDELAARVAAAEQQLAFERKRQTELGQAIASHQAAADAADQRRAAAVTRRESLASRLAQAEAELPAAKAELQAAATAEGEARELLQKLRDRQLEGKDGRIGLLRAGLVLIRDERDTYLGAAGAAEDALEGDDTTERQLIELPVAMANAQAQVEQAAAAAQQARERVAELEGVSAQADQLEALSADESSAADDRSQALSSVAAATKSKAACAELIAKADDEHAAAGEELEAVKPELVEVGKRAKLAAALDQAETRVAELEPLAAAAELERNTVAAELAGLGELPGPLVPPAPLDPIEQGLRVHRTAAASWTQAAASALDRHEHAVAGQARTAELSAEREHIERDLSDWRLLEAGLGRNGIQALEVDAAGPELTAMANDLLHTCLGPRFSVAIETTRQSSDGKKQIEGCSVMVFDAETGRNDEAKTYSGGECVMVAEAVDLSIAMLGAQHAGLESPTLVRDERGAALSPAKARAYMAMLRRAAELTGAAQVLFVSHNPEMVGTADARLNIADGRAWVS